MPYFSTIEAAPPDPILGLSEAFKNDTRPHKVNLSVGVYQDHHGQTPTLPSVLVAEEKLARQGASKSYLAITGDPRYASYVQQLIFGSELSCIHVESCRTVQTPGGTGALRIAADFVAQNLKQPTVWVSDPTWANHKGIFAAAGLPVETYPYFAPQTSQLRSSDLLECLNQIPEGDIVLLHGCCHNPTGVDPTPHDWKQIARILQQRKLVPLIDLAYQGFAKGLSEDAVAVHTLAQHCPEMLIASSFSKNFSLYNERVGALTLLAAHPDDADKALSQIKRIIRTNYSNPPAHGARIVSTILADDALRQQWVSEVDGMRQRIHDVRSALVSALESLGVNRDFSFINRQQGMFSFTGLNAAQVDRLRTEYAIYIVDSGRINIAGLNETNLQSVAEAIRNVL